MNVHNSFKYILRTIFILGFLLLGILIFTKYPLSKENMELSLHSSLDLKEKVEFQYGEVPIYLKLQYNSKGIKQPEVIVVEMYKGMMVETEYELFNKGTKEQVEMFVQVAKNVKLDVGDYDIKLFYKDDYNSDELSGTDKSSNPLAETKIKVIPPKESILREGQVFRERKILADPFFALVGLTKTITHDALPLGDITELQLIDASSYYVYYTLGNLSEKYKNCGIRYSINEVSDDEENVIKQVYMSELIKPNEQDSEKNKTYPYFSGSVSLSSEELGKVKTGKVSIAVELVDSAGSVLHSVSITGTLLK